eukprot:EG_transcript_63025
MDFLCLVVKPHSDDITLEFCVLIMPAVLQVRPPPANRAVCPVERPPCFRGTGAAVHPGAPPPPRHRPREVDVAVLPGPHRLLPDPTAGAARGAHQRGGSPAEVP